MSTAAITELILAELDVPHESVPVDIRAGATKKPEHLKLDPNGRVPVIVHDGVPIWESAAITIYLGEQFGTAKALWPEAGPKRGEAMKWVVWTNVTFGDAVGRFTRNTMDWYPADQKNAKAGEAARGDIDKCLGILDGALEGRQFLCGAEYTLADTHLNSFCDWLRHMKIDFSKFKNVEAWGKRCSARPAYVKLMAKHGAS
jgi:glutathione S-transferase